jgi:hypothetical protein
LTEKIRIRKLRKRYSRFVKNIRIMDIVGFSENFVIKDIP